MRAVIWTGYGEPKNLVLKEIEKPSPKEDEILIRVKAASVTAGDCEMRRLELPLMLSFPMRVYAGLKKPTRIPILGQEFSGVVEKVGKKVNSYKVDDQVFGTTGFRFGAYAEYICLPGEPGDTQGTIAMKPNNISFEEAAVVPTAGFEALHYMKKASIKQGRKVLIIGAGGSIGTFSIQVAKYFGAEVTGVDRTKKLDMIHSIGADRTIDYTKEDYINSGESYDLIIDVVGRESVRRRLKLLNQGGFYFLAYASLSNVFLGVWTSVTSDKKIVIESSSQKQEDLNFLKNLIETGKIKPIVDRRFPLEQIPEAHMYAESGQKIGNISITINNQINSI